MSSAAQRINGDKTAIRPFRVSFPESDLRISSARLYWESKLAFFAPKGGIDSCRRERLSRRAL
jgi:hypothetical protein